MTCAKKAISLNQEALEKAAKAYWGGRHPLPHLQGIEAAITTYLASALSSKDAEIAALKKERDEARETAKRHRNKRDVAKSAARDNHRGLVTWQARATAAEAALKKAREALAEIADPLAAMQKRAEATGGRLSKLAYSIANNPHYLQEIARAYLDTEDKQ